MSRPTKITQILVKDDDITFYFEDSIEPWGIDEFIPDSRTRMKLEEIEAAIIDFNHPPPATRWTIGCPSGLHANDGRCDCR